MAVPLADECTFCATSVEKRGESAAIVIPQIKSNSINNHLEETIKNNGDIKQQIQDTNKAIIAVCFISFLIEIYPLL